jgi:3-oxoacyl-[acyl-carrier-protein] synthase-3
MSQMRRAGIRGTGSYLPSRVLTNDDLARMVDTSDEWITSRTGIKERRLAADGEVTSDMALAAARLALEAASLEPKDLGMIIVGTVSGDYIFPSTACLLQKKLGAPQVGAFDVSAACSGFIYALTTARQFVASGSVDNVLVVGVETLSRITDYTDRGSCILFGDGAGAVVVSSQFEHGELLSTELHAEGAGYDVIYIPAGGTLCPSTPETLAARKQFMSLRGREVYKFAVTKFVELIRDARDRHPELELGYIVPHQVNLRIIESAMERLALKPEQVHVNIERYGNTSAASIPIALDEALRSGRFEGKDGKLVVMAAFGAGLTWGSVSMKW